MQCCFTYTMHTKDAKNKKIKIFKFSLALYQILFRMYSGLCKKKFGACRFKMHDFRVIISTIILNLKLSRIVFRDKSRHASSICGMRENSQNAGSTKNYLSSKIIFFMLKMLLNGVFFGSGSEHCDVIFEGV